MKQISILGVTGTIGDNMLDLMRQHQDSCRLYAVSAHQNMDKLSDIIEEFKPQFVAVPEPANAKKIEPICRSFGCELLTGQGALEEVASKQVDLIVGAIVGMAGLPSIIAAVKAGQVIALANKESLVAAGHLVMPMLAQYGAKIIPVDSEHNAIYQCLMGHNRDEVSKIILTASGGPFRGQSIAQLQTVTRQDALAHPNWEMGAKVSIDSATMMNKGLELIEAAHLFNAGSDILSAVVHPQSLIHGMVDFRDSSLIAHMATADMRVPLSFALGLGDRLSCGVKALDLVALGKLEFMAIDETVFRCFSLAKAVIDEAPEKAVILNAANEVAVEAFLDGKIGFLSIADLVEAALEAQIEGTASDLENLNALDEQARHMAQQIMTRY